MWLKTARWIIHGVIAILICAAASAHFALSDYRDAVSVVASCGMAAASLLAESRALREYQQSGCLRVAILTDPLVWVPPLLFSASAVYFFASLPSARGMFGICVAVSALYLVETLMVRTEETYETVRYQALMVAFQAYLRSPPQVSSALP